MAKAKAKGVTALAPWFGSNRTLAHNVGDLLAGCGWVGVPFAGGMSELAHIKARTIVLSDLHYDIINLASVLSHPTMGSAMIRELRRTPFHETGLAISQRSLNEFANLPQSFRQCYERAVAYFICVWMGRSGLAGTDSEFKSTLAVRWTATGGDSATRFRSATEALRNWRDIMPRCTFIVRDCFDFLKEVHDTPDHGLYCDAPWPDDGDNYKHKFTEQQQEQLAETLAKFTATRVVVRFGDHPLIRRLYPADLWQWVEITGRTSTNAAKAEVLLVRNAK